MAKTNIKHSLQKNRRAHGWTVLIFICGTLFPPLAVAARFGIGGDFWLNLLLTICGYIPGHIHNFFIQNIRNNKTHTRTPKWAVRYGLVNTKKMQRNKKRSEWAHRYNGQNPDSNYEEQELEEGQVPDRPQAAAAEPGTQPAELWRAEEEGYYGQRNESSGSVESGRGRWHYPANFEDAEEVEKKSKSGKQDRWARTEDARNNVDDGKKRRKKKSSSRRTTTDDASSYRESIPEGPEDATGGSYGGSRGGAPPPVPESGRGGESNLAHEF